MIALAAAAIEDCFQGVGNFYEEFQSTFLPQSPDGSSEFAPCNFFSELRSIGCQLDNDDRTNLESAIEVVESSLKTLCPTRKAQDNSKESAGDEHQTLICKRFGLSHPSKHQRKLLAVEVHHRLLGFLYAALTASEVPRPEHLRLATDDSDWVQSLD